MAKSEAPAGGECLIIGDPVEHSLSPAMHNAGYRALGIQQQFYFAARRVTPADLGEALSRLKDEEVRGITCTIPHKTTVMKYLDQIDPTAIEIGAVNTVVNDGGKLKGYNTDWIGIVEPLERYCTLKGLRVGILGAGGAARAAVYGVKSRGAEVLILNRTLSHAEKLGAEFGCGARGLDSRDLMQCDVVINTTSVGMGPTEEISPVKRELLRKDQIVFDVIYKPYTTKLLADAEELGARIVRGGAMLVAQAIPQFRLYTGREVSREVLEKVVCNNLGVNQL